MLTHALKRGVWLLGLGIIAGSFLLQSVALHLGSLSQVQPILTSELLFLVFLLATWFGFRIGTWEWIGCVAAAGGLAGFLVFAQPGGGNLVPTAREWVVAASVCGGVMVLLVGLALRGPRWWRAAMFGAAGAVGFAFTASLIKTVSDYVATDWTQMFGHWQMYALVVCGVGSLFLAQNAYHAGPIASSQTALVLVDPLASIAIGIGLFGDTLRTSGVYGPLEAVALLVMFMGAAFVAHSPLVSGVNGDDAQFNELLSLRSRSKRLVEAIADPCPPEVLEHLPPETLGQLSNELNMVLPPSDPTACLRAPKAFGSPMAIDVDQGNG